MWDTKVPILKSEAEGGVSGPEPPRAPFAMGEKEEAADWDCDMYSRCGLVTLKSTVDRVALNVNCCQPSPKAV